MSLSGNSNLDICKNLTRINKRCTYVCLNFITFAICKQTYCIYMNLEIFLFEIQYLEPYQSETYFFLERLVIEVVLSSECSK